MMDELEKIRKMLLEGILLAKQSSYARRAPLPEAVPLLTQVRGELRAFVETQPDSAEGWNLLAQAEECLLNYSEARKSLERAMSLNGKRSNNDLKKLALYRSMEKEWGELLLTPVQLRDLAVYLREKLAVEPSGRTFTWTEKWLQDNGIANADKIIESIRANGAFDDFQVSENLARG
jgi:hypothetical protein